MNYQRMIGWPAFHRINTGYRSGVGRQRPEAINGLGGHHGEVTGGDCNCRLSWVGGY
jgi:hypothetical protein